MFTRDENRRPLDIEHGALRIRQQGSLSGIPEQQLVPEVSRHFTTKIVGKNGLGTHQRHDRIRVMRIEALDVLLTYSQRSIDFFRGQRRRSRQRRRCGNPRLCGSGIAGRAVVVATPTSSSDAPQAAIRKPIATRQTDLRSVLIATLLQCRKSDQTHRSALGGPLPKDRTERHILVCWVDEVTNSPSTGVGIVYTSLPTR